MYKNIAKIVPVLAIAAMAAACADQITYPDETAGIAPVDTLLARAPIDTFYAAQRAGIDTFYLAQRSQIDTFASARSIPVDTLY